MVCDWEVLTSSVSTPTSINPAFVGPAIYACDVRGARGVRGGGEGGGIYACDVSYGGPDRGGGGEGGERGGGVNGCGCVCGCVCVCLFESGGASCVCVGGGGGDVRGVVWWATAWVERAAI